jgi:bacteriorhodopsin
MVINLQPIYPTCGVVITYNSALKYISYASDYSISKIKFQINDTNVLA